MAVRGERRRPVRAGSAGRRGEAQAAQVPEAEPRPALDHPQRNAHPRRDLRMTQPGEADQEDRVALRRREGRERRPGHHLHGGPQGEFVASPDGTVAGNVGRHVVGDHPNPPADGAAWLEGGRVAPDSEEDVLDSHFGHTWVLHQDVGDGDDDHECVACGEEGECRGVASQDRDEELLVTHDDTWRAGWHAASCASCRRSTQRRRPLPGESLAYAPLRPPPTYPLTMNGPAILSTSAGVFGASKAAGKGDVPVTTLR